MTTFYHEQVGSLETQEFRTTPEPFWLVCFSDWAIRLTRLKDKRLLVIGSPEGLQGTVTEGIISAFRENRSMIQITAPISPGVGGRIKTSH
jgi:hypothetical protein